jgi:serine/threonine protein kinase
MEAGQLCIVTELATGGTMVNLLERYSVGMPERTTKKWMFQLILALAFCHFNGVMHRDIKPENVFVVGDEIRLADFGLSYPGSGAKTQREWTPNVWRFSLSGRSLILSRSRQSCTGRQKFSLIRLFMTTSLMYGLRAASLQVRLSASHCFPSSPCGLEMLRGSPLFMGDSEMSLLCSIFTYVL